MEYVQLDNAKMDGLCRAVKAVVEMLEVGVAVASVEFPMYHTGREEEVSMKIQAFRCSQCDEIHVQLEMQPSARLFDWNQEYSDEQLFGGGFDD